MDAEKAKLREGDSARARFFRHKDDLFGSDGGVKLIQSFLYQDGDPEKGVSEEKNKIMESIMPLFKDVRASIDELNANPDSEEALKTGIQRLDALKAKQDEVLKK